jgi:serine protease Do
MAKKHAIYLLLAITLSATAALAQQPVNPPEPLGAESFNRSFSFLIEGEGFLGVNVEDISKENMGRYGLRSVRGVGVTSVAKDSPAEKAGIRKDDVILRVDGDNVTSTRKLSRLISEIAPDQSVRITISRGGAEQEVTATIAKRDESPRFEGLLRSSPEVWRMENPPSFGGFAYAFGKSRRIGVSTIPLTKQLADYFGIADGKGLLITSVTEDGPAAKAGLKAGDVIVSVDGEKVEAAGDVSRIISQKKDGDVSVTIIRNKSQQTIRVTPKEGDSSFVFPNSTTRAGRQIVIPRIELPVIPEVNIALPRIEIPTIPEIKINIPVVRPIKVKNTERVRTI